jgi:hypothetical protein
MRSPRASNGTSPARSITPSARSAAIRSPWRNPVATKIGTRRRTHCSAGTRSSISMPAGHGSCSAARRMAE